MTGVQYTTANRYEPYLMSGEQREKNFDSEEALLKFSKNLRQYVYRYYPGSSLHIYRKKDVLGISILFVKKPRWSR